MLDLDVTYSDGPRFVNGVNIDSDVAAGHAKVITKQEVSDPVTGISGQGYQPGQKNRDGSEL